MSNRNVIPENLRILLALLPAGEYTSVEPLGNSGMVAGRNWGLIVKARSIRRNEAVAIKFMRVAPLTAGRTTELATAGQRLEVVRDRLAKLSVDTSVPVVQIYDVSLHDEGLLIVMQLGEPLHDVIEENRNSPQLSLDVLRSLGPMTGWHHFDICPRNAVVSGPNKVVLIDLESIYATEPTHCKITFPAFKQYRLTKGLHNELADNLPGIPIDLVRRRHVFDVLLLAAECALGFLPFGMGHLQIEEVIPSSLRDNPIGKFWFAELSQCETNPIPPNPLEVADRFERMLGGLPKGTIGVATSQPTPKVGKINIAAAPTPSLGSSMGTEDAGRRAVKQANLPPRLPENGAALRQGRLQPVQIQEYLEQIETELAKDPKQLGLWQEKILIAVSFNKNKELAESAISEALQHFPNEAELIRWQRIVNLWGVR